jgi:propionyl-CoA synthetase
VMGRVDDVINVAGHRLSTGRMEEVIAEHPAVAECAVVGVADTFRGQVPLALFVLKSEAAAEAGEVARQVVSMVREQVGAIANLKTALPVTRLPKTRSGKVLRATIRKIADGEPYALPPTIEEPGALREIQDVVETWRRESAR